MNIDDRLCLGSRHRFHNHAPQKLAIRLEFHQQATDKLRGDLLGGAGEEAMGEGLGVRGGYGSGLSRLTHEEIGDSTRNMPQSIKYD